MPHQFAVPMVILAGAIWLPSSRSFVIAMFADLATKVDETRLAEAPLTSEQRAQRRRPEEPHRRRATLRNFHR